VQDLPHGGRRHRNAELGELTADAAVTSQRVLLRQADGKAGDAPDRRGPAGLAALARVVLLRGQLAVPGQQRRGCDRKTSLQRLRGMSRASAESQARSAGS